MVRDGRVWMVTGEMGVNGGKSDRECHHNTVYHDISAHIFWRI